jgi:RNA polymerase sigma-70 factor (ECF subfamily)
MVAPLTMKKMALGALTLPVESLSVRGKAARDMDLYLMADGSTASITNAEPAAARAREEALRWFDELRDPLRRYLLCAGAGSADADEAVQESFLRLYQHLEKGGDRSNVRAWVFQVARNYLRDERKSARHQRTVPLEDAMESAGRFTDPGGSPEHCALIEEQTRRLREAVGKLPRQQRECMLLRSSGLRYREIAEILGIQTNSVGALVQRAVARLSEDLT